MHHEKQHLMADLSKSAIPQEPHAGQMAMTVPDPDPGVRWNEFLSLRGMSRIQRKERVREFLLTAALERLAACPAKVEEAVINFLTDEAGEVQDMMWVAVRTFESKNDGPINEILQVLVAMGAQTGLPNQHVEDPRERSIALNTVAQWGRADWVDAFAAAGADLDAKNDDGYTPAITAIWSGHDDVVLRLQAHGAKLAEHRHPTLGANLLHLACIFNRPGLIAMLASAGLDVNLPYPSGDEPVLLAYKSAIALKALHDLGADLHKVDHDGCSAARLAAEASEVDAFYFLLSHGASVDEAADDGHTIRDMARFKPAISRVIQSHETRLAAMNAVASIPDLADARRPS